MIPFQENAQSDIEGWTDPTFKDPFNDCRGLKMNFYQIERENHENCIMGFSKKTNCKLQPNPRHNHVY